MAYFGGFLYHTGGFTYTGGTDDSTNVFYATVSSNGIIGSWIKTTGSPEGIYDHASIAANGFLYVLGGMVVTTNGDLYSDALYYSKLNLDGSIGVWQAANRCPYALTLLSAAEWNNRIFIVGGFTDSGATNGVFSAQIQTNGSLGPWVAQTPLPLNGGIFAHASVANGNLYVIGGLHSNGYTLTRKVYYSKINADGTLAGWAQTSLLPQAVSDIEAVAANGRIFAIGGTDGFSPLNYVQNATVNGDGSLNPWSLGTPLPRPLTYHASAVSGSHIFVSGGADDVIIQDAVYSMPLPPPPTSPTITPQGFGTEGHFQLNLASDTNAGIGILASTNLTNWERIGWGFTGTNGLLSFQDTNTAQFGRRFYRAYWPLP